MVGLSGLSNESIKALSDELSKEAAARKLTIKKPKPNPKERNLSRQKLCEILTTLVAPDVKKRKAIKLSPKTVTVPLNIKIIIDGTDCKYTSIDTEPGRISGVAKTKEYQEAIATTKELKLLDRKIIESIRKAAKDNNLYLYTLQCSIRNLAVKCSKVTRGTIDFLYSINAI